MTIKDLSRDELLSLFDASVHDAIESRLDQPGTFGAIVFENLDFCSSRFGHRTACVWGPARTYTPEVVARLRQEPMRFWLNDLPSQRQYPTAIYTNEDAEQRAADDAHAAKLNTED